MLKFSYVLKCDDLFDLCTIAKAEHTFCSDNLRKCEELLHQAARKLKATKFESFPSYPMTPGMLLYKLECCFKCDIIFFFEYMQIIHNSDYLSYIVSALGYCLCPTD